MVMCSVLTAYIDRWDSKRSKRTLKMELIPFPPFRMLINWMAFPREMKAFSLSTANSRAGAHPVPFFQFGAQQLDGIPPRNEGVQLEQPQCQPEACPIPQFHIGAHQLSGIPP